MQKIRLSRTELLKHIYSEFSSVLLEISFWVDDLDHEGNGDKDGDSFEDRVLVMDTTEFSEHDTVIAKKPVNVDKIVI